MKRQSISHVAMRARATLAVALAAAAGQARADGGWDDLGMLGFVGVFPLMILLAAFVVSVFVSRAPWWHKLWCALGIAAGLEGTFLLMFGSHTLDVSIASVTLLWLVPGALWAGLAYWLARKR